MISITNGLQAIYNSNIREKTSIEMNDEIKEILEHIKNYPEKLYCLNENEKHLLLDYITNLQRAIKDTKDTADDMLYELKQENERLKEWKKDLLNENIELENIRKEAIEYIKSDMLESFVWYEDLLNILQNGSDNE